MKISVNVESGGFQNYHQRAIKPEWDEHYVSYDILKSKLSAFTKRRKALKKIRYNTGGTVTEDDLFKATLAHGLDTNLVSGNDKKKGKDELESKYYPYKDGQGMC